MSRITFITLLLLFGSRAEANASIQKTAENVLEKLYLANGNQVYLKPQIAITKDDTEAALFLRRTNTIELSEKAYGICQSIGKDSLSALAFMLGHELAHAYQTDLKAASTSFLAYDHHPDGDIVFEEAADVQGVFMAYLADYRTVHILPELIDRIYREFDLPARMSGYPSLLERQNTVKKVQSMSTELIWVYEAGNYLLAIGKYDLAIACFEHVENWYKGREVYNNLGLGFTFLAMNFTADNADAYLFPLEISWDTRMNKDLIQRGGKALDPEERRLRELYLQKAERHFITAAKMDPRFLTAEINLMCALILKGEYSDAIDYYNGNKLSQKARMDGNNSLPQLRLALAIAYAYNGEADNARRIWQDIKANGSGLEAFQADFNLKTLNGEQCEARKTSACPQVPGTETSVDGVKLYRPELAGEWISLQPDDEVQVSISEKPHSLVYTFKKDGANFSMQRVFEPLSLTAKGLYAPSGVFTNNGMITACEDAKLSFLVDGQGKLVEWAKYH